MVKQLIPNLITLANLLCGVLASLFAAVGHLPIAALFICLGIFFDFFDGLTARLLGVTSPLGKELDSLADVVTSGVAPGLILMAILWNNEIAQWIAYIALLIPLFAAYRLAKFNIDTRQSHSFLGLPTPANALIWAGLVTAFPYGETLSSSATIILIIISILTDILMVSDVPMFSLKFNFKDMSWKNNSTQYIFLIGCAVIVAIARDWYSISLIILWYILLSFILLAKKKLNAR